jgi:hypothetical protein
VDVTTCFAPLLRWIVALWTGTQLALARDATSWGARFVVLTLRGVYRGCAIPVAWTVLPANLPGAWRRDWLRLLRLVRSASPSEPRCGGLTPWRGPDSAIVNGRNRAGVGLDRLGG